MIERVARPLRGLSNGAARVMSAIFRGLGMPGKLLQDFLNGAWLGHSLHAVLVDVVIGAATSALLLDLLRIFFAVEGLETATTWVIGLAWISGVGAILTGLTDFKDTAPDSATRDTAGLHGLINIVGNGGFAFSTIARLNGNHDAGFAALLIGYLIISVGSYIGGHVVFKYGYMVNHNAFARGKRANDFTAVFPAADLPEGTATRVTFGATAVVLVRRGDLVHALKGTCSHAGGPLSEGKLDGDTIECPWHQSVFKLTDGSVVHGRRARARCRIGRASTATRLSSRARTTEPLLIPERKEATMNHIRRKCGGRDRHHRGHRRGDRHASVHGQDPGTAHPLKTQPTVAFRHGDAARLTPTHADIHQAVAIGADAPKPDQACTPGLLAWEPARIRGPSADSHAQTPT